ncbi:hypothetical protein F2Q68_00026360 [Brassica cretica]|uniref:Uncharacterized protein n=1 Tax=Brassica cretica TaxID=69181 RepID=A0A8S9IBM6_BRACR|nr:hypothetical protein F2Q68_00026360 [Brassica cretica]
MIGHNQKQLAEALVTCIQHGQTAKLETKHTHKNRDRALFGKRNLQESPLAVEPTHKKTETGSTTYEKRSVAALDLAPETSLSSTRCHRSRKRVPVDKTSTTPSHAPPQQRTRGRSSKLGTNTSLKALREQDRQILRNARPKTLNKQRYTAPSPLEEHRRTLRPCGTFLPRREGGALKTKKKTNLFQQPDLTPDRDHRLLARPKETPHRPHLYASPKLRVEERRI